MKKGIILVILAAMNLAIYAQSRLGSSFNEIKNEFSDAKYNLKTDKTDDGVLYILIETTKTSVVHYFDSDLICTVSVILPDDQGTLNYIVEEYNKQYVIVSKKKWRMYTNDGIAEIELIFSEDNNTYFVWKVLE